MEPERTTTIGDGESLMTERPFHICDEVSMCLVSDKIRVRTIKAVDRISAKFMSCAAACRGFPRLDNMATGV